LILNWRFQPPLTVVTTQLNLVVTVLDDNAIQFFAIEINNVLRLTFRIFRIGKI